MTVERGPEAEVEMPPDVAEFVEEMRPYLSPALRRAPAAKLLMLAQFDLARAAERAIEAAGAGNGRNKSGRREDIDERKEKTQADHRGEPDPAGDGAEQEWLADAGEPGIQGAVPALPGRASEAPDGGERGGPRSKGDEDVQLLREGASDGGRDRRRAEGGTTQRTPLLIRIEHREASEMQGKIIPVRYPDRDGRSVWVFHMEQHSEIGHRNLNAPAGIEVPAWRFIREQVDEVHLYLSREGRLLIAPVEIYEQFAIEARFGWRHRLYLPRQHWRQVRGRWYRPLHVPDYAVMVFHPEADRTRDGVDKAEHAPSRNAAKPPQGRLLE